jgi:hypothetical protein
MVVNVAIAIQAEGILELKIDAVCRIFYECKEVAEAVHKKKGWGSYLVHFELDEEKQIVQAWTKSDDFHNGKKPIFTIEKAVCTCAMECFEAANCRHQISNQFKIK